MDKMTKNVQDDIKLGFVKQAKELIEKANSDGTIKEIDEMLQDLDIRKSFDEYVAKNMADDKMTINHLMSIMFDVEVSRNTIDGYDFPSESTGYRILRQGGRSLPAQLIKSYRHNQIIEFAKISDGKNPGFNITYLDKQKKLTKAEKKKCEEAENHIARNFFFIPNNETPSMSSFLFYAYNDIFDLDTIAIEIVRENGSFSKKYSNRGKPAALCIVDAGIIHPVIPKVEEMEQHSNFLDFYQPQKTREKQESLLGYKTYFQDEYRYGMVDRQLKLVALFTPEKLIYSHFYGTTDIEHQFKGLSVVERALNVMRYIIDSITYNVTRRSANTMPKGMIAVVGATEDGFSKQEMTLFRKLIWGISAGRNDKWKYPVIGLPKGVDPKFIRFHESSKEMEDFLWMSTLFSWLCTFEGLHPEDVSMASNKNSVGKQRLFDKQEEEGAMVRSQDPGLRRFLNNMADTLNNAGMFEELTGIEGVGIVWSGLDVEDQGKKIDIDKKRLETTCSVNELLVEADKEKYELKVGDINLYDLPAISNPQFLQLISNALMAQGQQEEGEYPEGEGQDEGGKEGEYDEYPDWDEAEEGEAEKSIKRKRLRKSVGGKDVTLTVEY